MEKVPERTTVETFTNISPENKAYYDAEKEAIHLILTGIGDEIYSTVDACKTAHDMWIAIERLQHGESLNKQDVKTSLFWEFGRITSRDGESIESCYSRFYKMMNEMVRNQLEVATMQVNVQFLQQLQLEWSRFMTIIKQTIDLDKESYHKLFDILKQYQKEVNEIRVEKIARNTNPLALVVQQDAEYNVFANKKQHSEQPGSINITCVVEKVDSNVIPDSSNMCDNDDQADQNAEECDDERVVLANLIANLKLDKYKSALEKCKSSLAKSSRTRDRCLGALHDKEVELEKYKIFKDRTIKNDTLERKLKETLRLLAQKEHDIKEEIKECDCLAAKLSKQTENVSKKVYNELSRSFAKLEKHSFSLELALQQCQEQIKHDKAQLKDNNITINELKKLIEKLKGKSVNAKFDEPSVVRQPNALRILKTSVLANRLRF
ncbi:hypothetical protein Tco_1383845 [Tanacetum coccineum]